MKKEEHRSGAAISFRIEFSVKDALERAAAEDQRSVSSLVLKILVDWLVANKYLPPRRKR
jgi:uncharacterized protein (DUF1778 family)